MRIVNMPSSVRTTKPWYRKLHTTCTRERERERERERQGEGERETRVSIVMHVLIRSNSVASFVCFFSPFTQSKGKKE